MINYEALSADLIDIGYEVIGHSDVLLIVIVDVNESFN